MSRNFEACPGGQEKLCERVFLPYSDKELINAVLDNEGSRALYDSSPVLWTRSAIAVGSERKPSDVTDEELIARLLERGLEEWDPNLTYSLTYYLQNQGFFIFKLDTLLASTCYPIRVSEEDNNIKNVDRMFCVRALQLLHKKG